MTKPDPSKGVLLASMLMTEGDIVDLICVDRLRLNALPLDNERHQQQEAEERGMVIALAYAAANIRGTRVGAEINRLEAVISEAFHAVVEP
jgi:hypothetical protein